MGRKETMEEWSLVKFLIIDGIGIEKVGEGEEFVETPLKNYCFYCSETLNKLLNRGLAIYLKFLSGDKKR